MKLEYCAGSNGTLTHKTFKHKISRFLKKKTHSHAPTLKVSQGFWQTLTNTHYQTLTNTHKTLTNTHSQGFWNTHAQNTHSHLHRRQGDSHKHSLTHKTLTLTYIGGKGTLRRRQLLGSSAARGLRSTVPSFSLSLSIGLPLIVSAENPNEPQIIIRNPKFAC